MRPAKGVNQVVWLWRRDKYRKHFLQILSNTQFRKCPKTRATVVAYINKICDQGGHKDPEMYRNVHHLLHDVILTGQPGYEIACDEFRAKLKKMKGSSYRSDHRSDKLLEILQRTLGHSELESIETVLDIGCADGRITSAIGVNLNIDSCNIHGCDVYETDCAELTDSDDSSTENENRCTENDAKLGYVHHTLEDPGVLPYADNSMNLVVAMMSLHHIEKLGSMLGEIKRVLKPGGYFFIREHNVCNWKMQVILDVVHGFYQKVWPHQPDDSDFSGEFLNYKSAGQWTNLIEKYGFYELYNDSQNEGFWKERQNGRDRVVNPLRYYYALYQLH